MYKKNNFLNVSIHLFKDVRVIRLLFLGFSSGLPILLIFSTLSLWLKSAGIERSTITLFSWAGLAYGFKFLWAPLMDRIKIPVLADFIGHRKSWLALTQLFLIISLISVGYVDPNKNLFLMGSIIVIIGISSASQDAMVDTFRIESGPKSLQSIMSSTYIIGYRLGMIVAGAGSLFLASYLGADNINYNPASWQLTYIIMGLLQSIGLVCCLTSPEPSANRNLINDSIDKLKLVFCFFVGLSMVVLAYRFFPNFEVNDPTIKSILKILNFFLAMFLGYCSFYILLKLKITEKKILSKTFWEPVNEFLKNYGKVTIWLIIIIGTYRISDIVLGVIANLFYVDMGFSLNDIATFSKFWGLIATLAGGVLGGILSSYYNNYKVLILGAILSASTNLLFALLSALEPKLVYLCFVILADNLSGGIASVAFVAFLSSLTNRDFTTTQFALFTSLMLFFPKILGGYSGAIVDTIGYTSFFTFTAIIGVPVILIIFFLKTIITNIK